MAWLATGQAAGVAGADRRPRPQLLPETGPRRSSPNTRSPTTRELEDMEVKRTAVWTLPSSARSSTYREQSERAMREDGKIDYIELPGGDLPVTKAFYADAFGWSFTDYGPSYAAFERGPRRRLHQRPARRQGAAGRSSTPTISKLCRPRSRLPAAWSRFRSTPSPAAAASTSATRAATSWRYGRKKTQPRNPRRGWFLCAG